MPPYSKIVVFGWEAKSWARFWYCPILHQRETVLPGPTSLAHVILDISTETLFSTYLCNVNVKVQRWGVEARKKLELLMLRLEIHLLILEITYNINRCTYNLPLRKFLGSSNLERSSNLADSQLTPIFPHCRHFSVFPPQVCIIS